MAHDRLIPCMCFILNTLATSSAYTCTTEVLNPKGSYYTRTVTFLDCNPVFEKCCDTGCCTRFSHAHIWIFAAGISFILFFCIFGCWLFCCKEKLRRIRAASRPPVNDDRVDSPLNIVVPEPRNDAPRTENQNNNPIPTTPPPTYEEATAMR